MEDLPSMRAQDMAEAFEEVEEEYPSADAQPVTKVTAPIRIVVGVLFELLAEGKLLVRDEQGNPESDAAQEAVTVEEGGEVVTICMKKIDGEKKTTQKMVAASIAYYVERFVPERKLGKKWDSIRQNINYAWKSSGTGMLTREGKMFTKNNLDDDEHREYNHLLKVLRSRDCERS
eukprot:SAG31_NODE_10111_length_1181_cov_1.161738_1_plen_174_part_10